jgi:hypothetical protein
MNSEPVNGNINALWNAGTVGNHNITVLSDPKLPYSLTETEPMEIIRFYEIPLLTKEQALHFDPDIEIPAPKAHLGKYPAATMIAVQDHIRVFGTDLRAIVVFNNQMTPILNMGDIAIFEASGWGSDGIYLYRMNNDLHINYVKFDDIKLILFKNP